MGQWFTVTSLPPRTHAVKDDYEKAGHPSPPFPFQYIIKYIPPSLVWSKNVIRKEIRRTVVKWRMKNTSCSFSLTAMLVEMTKAQVGLLANMQWRGRGTLMTFFVPSPTLFRARAASDTSAWMAHSATLSAEAAMWPEEMYWCVLKNVFCLNHAGVQGQLGNSNSDAGRDFYVSFDLLTYFRYLITFNRSIATMIL